MTSNKHIEIIPLLNGDSLGKDKRLLIPFKYNDKIGFFDSHLKVKVFPIYSAYEGDCYTKNDFIIVRRPADILYPDDSAQQFYGVINSEGKELIPAEHDSITILSENPKIYKGINKGKCCSVYALWYNEKLETFVNKFIGSYFSIDPFREGLSRISTSGWNNDRTEWGIINELGKKVLNYGYIGIEPFYDNDKNYIELRPLCIDEEVICHEFKSINRIKEEWKEQQKESHKRYLENWNEHYDLIEDGLDGMADAYWNID